MKKLIAGIFSPTTSLQIYEYENGVLRDAVGDYIPLKTYYYVINTLNEKSSEDAHFLIRHSGEEYFCEFVVRFKPQTEVFLIGYGTSPEEALENCLMKLKEV